MTAEDEYYSDVTTSTGSAYQFPSDSHFCTLKLSRHIRIMWLLYM
jgi:hypothetical protein